MYYSPSQTEIEAGRPSATDVNFLGFGIINLHIFSTILHSTICTRALLKSLWASFLGSASLVVLGAF
jgi:hypothetical protein